LRTVALPPQEPHFDLGLCRFRLYTSGDPRGRPIEADELAYLVCPGRAGQGRERDRLQEIGLALGISPNQHRGRSFKGQVKLGIVSKIEKRNLGKEHRPVAASLHCDPDRHNDVEVILLSARADDARVKRPGEAQLYFVSGEDGKDVEHVFRVECDL
jgi:hypothetical protein